MRVLLTGARAPATLELARLCARAGHEVHVADTDRWHICRGSRLISSSSRLPSPRQAGHAAYAAALNQVIATRRIDVIVPTCEEIFHLAAIRDQLTATTLCEPRAVLATLHDKAMFPRATEAAGLRAPRTYQLHAARGADVSDLATTQYVVKRRFSRFATAVRFWQPGDAPPLRQDEHPADWIAQERLHGQSLCSWSIAHGGQLRAHVTYAVDATAGVPGAAISFHAIAQPAVRAWVTQFLGHHRLTGQFALDFIEHQGTLRALECNPRLTSGIHCFRDLPQVAACLLAPEWPTGTPILEPPSGVQFRSRLALLAYGRSVPRGRGLLDATDDPWPRRLQSLAWLQLLVRAARHGTSPRVLSTADIEWNGE